MLAFQSIAIYNKIMTYNLFMPFMLLKFGNFEPSPTKSLILLHRVAPSISVSDLQQNSKKKKRKEKKKKNTNLKITWHERILEIMQLMNYWLFFQELYVNLNGRTHSSVKLLRIEMLKRIGPSKPVAWISLLTTQFNWI